MFDFLVLGGGIAGASIAFELARQARVCVVEAEARPGVHATGRSAALFAPSYGGPAARILTRASRAFFTAPPDGFCDHPLLSARGCLYIARQDQTDALGRLIADVRQGGGAISALSAPEALARLPLLRRDYVEAAAFDEDAMDIDVDGLHQGFLRGARGRGVRFVFSVPPTPPERSAGVWRLATPEGEVRAPVLVNAAGAWADQVAEMSGASPVGLQPLRRTAVLVDPPAQADARVWPAVIDADEQFYFKPDAGRLLLSPADETPDTPRDAYPEELDIATAVERVEAALEIGVRRVSHSWAGLRTFSPDRAPVIGYDADAPGFFWCAGQGGFGIQTSPAFARVAAALALGGPLPEDVVTDGLTATELAPARFQSAPQDEDA